jgi:hypothetical protein
MGRQRNMAHVIFTARATHNFASHMPRRMCVRCDFRRWTPFIAVRCQAIQVLLSVRKPGWNGVVSEKDVRAAEVREPLVGYFLSQAHASAFHIEPADVATFWSPDAQHPERRNRPRLCFRSPQLIKLLCPKSGIGYRVRLMPDSQDATSSACNRVRGADLARVNFPTLRWVALAWLVVWIPAYWHVWGWQNFLHLCDIAVILACLGILVGNRLLISSQMLATAVPSIIWSLDAGWRVFFHHNLIGGTEYLWDATVPLWVRMLSLFHIGLPILLVVLCARIGYDRRAFAFQSGITFVLFVVSRWMGAAANLNYVFADPIFRRALGPVPIHFTIILASAVLLFYLPAHILIGRNFSRWA